MTSNQGAEQILKRGKEVLQIAVKCMVGTGLVRSYLHVQGRDRAPDVGTFGPRFCLRCLWWLRRGGAAKSTTVTTTERVFQRLLYARVVSEKPAQRRCLIDIVPAQDKLVCYLPIGVAPV
jgi:hypothetical protein